MIEAIVGGVLALLVLGLLFGLYKWGQNSQKVREREDDLKEADREADILEKQRDDRIDSVDDADKLFDDWQGK